VILGAGIDLIEVARFERETGRRGEDLLATLFSPSELAACRRDRHPCRSYAAAFAVKEALFKAIGTGWAGGVSWRDVEVARPRGPVTVQLAGEAALVARRLGVERVHATTTATPRVAMASVVLEGKGPGARSQLSARRRGRHRQAIFGGHEWRM